MKKFQAERISGPRAAALGVAIFSVVVLGGSSLFAQRGGAQLGLGLPRSGARVMTSPSGNGGAVGRRGVIAGSPSTSQLGLPTAVGTRVTRPSSLATRTTSAAANQPANIFYGPAIGGAYLGGSYLYSPYAYWSGYAFPQSYYGRQYPPPVALEPRLGLGYNYPFAWHMGLQLPVDTSPSHADPLPPFQGVVRSRRAAERRQRSSLEKAAVEDLRAGRYKSAGLSLTEGYRQTDDAVYPLLLSEALFALGKYRHAELVLLEALKDENALGKLPRDVASHFPSKDVFARKLEALRATGSHEFLTAYLALFADGGDAALAKLLELSDSSSKSTAAAAKVLYRHHLDKVFSGEEDDAEGAEQPAK